MRAWKWKILQCDCIDGLTSMSAGSVQCCVTSPPYWGLRDYGHDKQLGLEKTPEEYVERIVEVFREVWRVLRDDGTLWLNLGDSYAGAPGGWQGKNGQRSTRTFTARIKHRKGGRVRPGQKQASNAASDFDGPHRGLALNVPPKNLVGIPWRVAFALQADGWYLRSDIIWAKPNPMPESVTDRPTKAHEYLFLLAKSERYFYDADAIAEPYAAKSYTTLNAAQGGYGDGTGLVMAENWKRDVPIRKMCGVGGSVARNRRTVWTIPTQPSPGAHFAVFPPALVEPCVLAGSREEDTVLDPFAGSGTVGVVCRKHNRHFVGIELNPEYARMARGRLGENVTSDPEAAEEMPLFAAAEEENDG